MQRMREDLNNVLMSAQRERPNNVLTSASCG